MERHSDQVLEHTVVSFHLAQLNNSDPQRPSTLVARRRVATQRRVTTTYAEARTCPVLEDVLIAIEHFEQPRADFRWAADGVLSPRTDGERLTNDDERYVFTTSQAAFTRKDSPAQLTVTSGAWTPLGAWARLSLAAMSACWTSSMPR